MNIDDNTAMVIAPIKPAMITMATEAPRFLDAPEKRPNTSRIMSIAHETAMSPCRRERVAMNCGL